MSVHEAIALAGPEVILALSTLVLLIWGAFAGRATTLFTLAAMGRPRRRRPPLGPGPLGRAFSGGLIADQGAVFAKVVI